MTDQEKQNLKDFIDYQIRFYYEELGFEEGQKPHNRAVIHTFLELRKQLDDIFAGEFNGVIHKSE